MISKETGLQTDQVFLDLEDSVAPALKNDETRECVVRALAEQKWSHTRVVRVNAAGTPWCLDDLDFVVAEGGP